MPSPTETQLLSGNYAPVPDETTLVDLTVDGTLPAALAGRYVRIGPNPIAVSPTFCCQPAFDGMVHAVTLRAGRAISYRNRWITTDAVAHRLGIDPMPGQAAPVDNVATNVLRFAGRTLALGPGALAYELDEDLATIGRVDLAGRGRGIGAHPQIDPVTGALYLVSYGAEAAHHVVSPSGLTRQTHPTTGAPGPIDDLLLTRDRVVLLGAGFVGFADRASTARPRWVAAQLGSAVSAQQEDHAVTVLTAGASLARWSFDTAGRARHEALDDTPQRFGRINPRLVGARTRYLWTVAAPWGTEVYRHDLHTGDRTTHHLGAGRHPGEFTFVPDVARQHREDGGWLLGLAHDDRSSEADLIVLDAAALDRPPIATVHIPRRIPYGLHSTWIPVA